MTPKAFDALFGRIGERAKMPFAADADRIRTLAKELVDLRPNAIFGVTTPAIGALARETRTIPIVFAGVRRTRPKIAR